MREQRGVILVVTLVIMSILLSVALAFSIIILSDIKKAGAIDNSILAYYAADAGLEQSLFLMRRESNSTAVDNIDDLLSLISSATLSNNSGWDISSSVGSESVVYRQRLDNGESVRLYFLDRSGAGTNNAKSITVDWEKGGGSPKLQIAFTQINPQYEDIGIGSDVLINYTDVNDVITFDTSTECYDFGDQASDSSPFVSDYVVEVKAIGSADEYVDNLTIKSYGVNCSSIVDGETEVDGEAITNLTIRSGGTYNGAYQEIVAHLPPKGLVSGISDFVLFSDEDITKDTNTRGYVQPSCFDTDADPIPICTCDDLDNIRNYLTRNFELQNDIDFAGCDARYTTDPGWVPISFLEGSFDGNNKTISNLYIGGTSDNVGLFGILAAHTGDSMEIRDLNIVNANITGNSNVGALAGRLEAVSIGDFNILNVNMSSSMISGTNYVGGLMGNVDEIVIFNSHAEDILINASGGQWTGGLFGYVRDRSEIDQSSFGGTINATQISVGGLVGGLSNGSSINRSYSTAIINGSNHDMGGIAAYTNNATIDDSYFYGTINGTGRTGGLVGSLTNSSQLNNSYAIGNVNSTGASAGVVAYGNSSSISNVHSAVLVDFSNGRNTGFIYDNSGVNISNSYWVSSINDMVLGCSIGDDCSGVHEEEIIQMLHEVAYQPEWDFFGDGLDDIWRINEGNEYPCLNWQAPGTCPAPDIIPCFNPADDPIKICTCDELDRVRDYLSSNFALQNDIDFNAETCSTYTSGEGWEPIGSGSNPFRGIFDGGEYVISNLYINRSGEHIGFLGHISGATIRDVGLNSVRITGDDFYVGGLVGTNYNSIVENSYSSGDIDGYAAVGGLVGYNYQGIVRDSYSVASVSGTYYVGGLVGNSFSFNPDPNPDSIIEDSYATGDVYGDLIVGGLVGRNFGNSSISNSYAIGGVEGNNSVGGLVGDNSASYITNSYSVGGVVGGGALVGGLVGNDQSVLGYGDSIIINSYWDTYYSNQPTSAGGTGLDTIYMLQENSFQPEWDFTGDVDPDDIWRINEGNEYPCLNWQAPGTCPAPDIIPCFNPADDPIKICTCDELDRVRDYLSSNFALQNDIDFATCDARYTTGEGWEPIGDGSAPNLGLSGSFEGNNHTISNLFINKTIGHYVGLFGWLQGDVSNLNLTSANVTAAGSGVGILAGHLRDRDVNNVASSGEVNNSGTYTGGLIGWLYEANIINSNSSADVLGSQKVGGLTGYNYISSIVDSYATGQVTGVHSTGGLVGENRGVNTQTRVSSIDGSYATGDVVSSWYAGGLVGYNEVNSVISNSYAIGSVTVNDYYGGGLTGANASNSVISNSYSTGLVSGAGTNQGGLSGYDWSSGGVTYSYWDTYYSGQPTSAGGTGLETLPMLQEATYQPEWDFWGDDDPDDIWKMIDDHYPCLSWQALGTCPAPDVAPDWTCGDALTDTRDDQTYSTVLIGTQCWMAENLNIGTQLTLGAGVTQGSVCGSAPAIQKYCYSNNAANCTTYGGLYEWNQAMCGSILAGSQGICPLGWHIPTHDEFTTLERAVCTSDTCATDFPFDTSTAGWRGTNEGPKLATGGLSGWGGLFAGNSHGGSFYALGTYGYWWSSLQSGTSAWLRALLSGNAQVFRYPLAKVYGFSVRCLKN